MKKRLKYEELIRQEYTGNNCMFSAGFVEGDKVDNTYLKLEKDYSGKHREDILLFTPDELMAIGWCCIGVAWSILYGQRGSIGHKKVVNLAKEGEANLQKKLLTSEIKELVAKELFDIWKEAKSTANDNWDDVTFEALPEKHKHEYYLTVDRIVSIIMG